MPLAVVAAACSSPSPEAEPVVTVQMAKAAQGSITDIVTADAVLYPLRQAAIVAKISAPVERFYVERGARVGAGQVLVVLEHQDLAAVVAQDQGLYEQAQANYETVRQATVPADLQKAQLDVLTSKEALDVQQKIYDDRQMLFQQGAVPQRDVATASVALSQARSQYEVAGQHLQALQAVTQAQTLKTAEAQVASAKGQYDAAQAQLGYSTIRSPIDGYVTDRPFYAGEMASPGTPLLTVMDTSAVVARAPVPAAAAGTVIVGDSARLHVPGFEEPVDGKVTVVSPALDPASTTMQVWVESPNPDGQLKPGTSVRVDIVARTVPDAVIVPASALLTGGEGGSSVMVVGIDGKAHARPVEIGLTQADRVQVTKGLQAGETVVTAGAYGLADGTKVQVELQPAQAGSEPPAK
jgi:HlyD family secretion protein